MALTTVGVTLTEQHRLRQIAVRALVVKQVLTVWPLFDVKAIDESWEVIEPMLMASIAQGRLMSSLLSNAYYRDFRLAEHVEGDLPEIPRLGPEWEAAALVSLRVTGPVAAKKAVLLSRFDASNQALTSVTGAASRHTLNGGRDTLEQYLKTDKKVRGYSRVTSGKACAFCAMLAGRGPVYQVSHFKSHDHCTCSMEPVYSSSQPWPANSRRYQSLWNETTKDTKGHESISAFRKALEG